MDADLKKNFSTKYTNDPNMNRKNIYIWETRDFYVL